MKIRTSIVGMPYVSFFIMQVPATPWAAQTVPAVTAKQTLSAYTVESFIHSIQQQVCHVSKMESLIVLMSACIGAQCLLLLPKFQSNPHSGILLFHGQLVDEGLGSNSWQARQYHTTAQLDLKAFSCRVCGIFAKYVTSCYIT